MFKLALNGRYFKKKITATQTFIEKKTTHTHTNIIYKKKNLIKI
jgi:hypothetical protein